MVFCLAKRLPRTCNSLLCCVGLVVAQVRCHVLSSDSCEGIRTSLSKYLCTVSGYYGFVPVVEKTVARDQYIHCICLLLSRAAAGHAATKESLGQLSITPCTCNQKKHAQITSWAKRTPKCLARTCDSFLCCVDLGVTQARATCFQVTTVKGYSLEKYLCTVSGHCGVESVVEKAVARDQYIHCICRRYKRIARPVEPGCVKLIRKESLHANKRSMPKSHRGQHAIAFLSVWHTWPSGLLPCKVPAKDL